MCADVCHYNRQLAYHEMDRDVHFAPRFHSYSFDDITIWDVRRQTRPMCGGDLRLFH